jgi:hypothetical protein
MIAVRGKGGLTLLACAAALAATAPARASAWAREAGELFVSSRADFFRATADAPQAPGLAAPRFERFDSDTYTEYGLSRAITIGGKALYGTSVFFDGAATSSASGFSEFEGFVQIEAQRGERSALSFRLSGAAPTSFRTGARPDLVSDGADLEARVLYGRNIALRPVKVFASLEAGYRKRFGAAADQIRADALVGIEPTGRLLMLVEVLSTTSLRNEAPGGADFDVLKIQPSAVWRASRRLTLQVGVTHETAGRNLLLGNTYFIGLWSAF